MKASALWYNGQKAIICIDNLETLQDKNSSGRIALAYELGNDDPADGCYHIIWEWGGDWTAFDENFFNDKFDPGNYRNPDTNYAEELEKIEEDAKEWVISIKNAIKKAKELCCDCAEDLEWYEDLAENNTNIFAEEWQELIEE